MTEEALVCFLSWGEEDAPEEEPLFVMSVSVQCGRGTWQDGGDCSGGGDEKSVLDMLCLGLGPGIVAANGP